MDEKLIVEVERRPILYDNTNEYYKNNVVRVRIWRDVAAALNASTELCQKRWKQLRNRYTRQQRFKTSSDCPLMNSLGFLKPFIVDDDGDLAPTFDLNDQMEEITTFKMEIYPESECLLTELAASPSSQHSPERVEPVTYNPQPAVAQKRKRIRKYGGQKDNEIDRILAAINTPAESFDTLDYYALTIAEDLRNMEPSEQRRVKMDIQAILANAQYTN